MSVKPRGGFGWDGPQQFGGGIKAGKTEAAADMIVRALKGGKLDAGMISMMAQAGTISQAVLDRVAEKFAGVHVVGVDWGEGHAPRAPVPEDTIDMIEIDGVWMSAADAHAARLQIGRSA